MRITLTDSEVSVLKARMKSDIQQLREVECSAKLETIISSAILTREKILAKLESLEIDERLTPRTNDLINAKLKE